LVSNTDAQKTDKLKKIIQMKKK